MVSTIDAPHLAIPFRIDNGQAVTVRQDTLDELIQNVAVIVGTRRGERLALPTFGISDPTFLTKVESAEILAAIEHWEDRADVRVQIAEPLVDGQRDVTLSVSSRGDS